MQFAQKHKISQPIQQIVYDDRGQNIDVDDEDDFLLGMTQANKKGPGESQSIEFKIFF